MSSILLVNDPQFYRCPVKPQNFEEWASMYERTGPGPLGLWELARIDARTGVYISRLWTKNVVTDNGATLMLQRQWNSSSATLPALSNQIAISFGNQGSTTLTAALSANSTGVTSISVQALPAQILTGTTITLGFGGAAPQNVTVNGTAALNATSITVTSFTVNSTGFAIGANVVPVPATGDNPSSLTNGAYSGALATGAFAYSGTGAGNRQVQIVFTYPTSTAAGNYTEAYMTNANPVVASSTSTHTIFPPQVINSTTNFQITLQEKV